MTEELKGCTVLYLITSTNVGGTEKALCELISRIDRDRYTPFVCSVKKPGAFAKKIERAAAGFYSLGLSEAGGIRAVFSFFPALFLLIKLIRRLQPVIIHSFLFRANILGRIAGKISGTPIIISSIRVIESDKKFKHIIDRLTSSLVSKYTAVTEASRQFTLERLKIKPERIVTIYNGIDTTEPGKASPDTAIDRAENNIALVGRIEKQKGHKLLIEAMKIVLPRKPDTKVFFFGEGPDEAHIRYVVQEQGLSKSIIFMGVVENIGRYVSLMDIIVLPSLWEGLPNVLLEAMAERRPVVASRIAGVDEVVIDGKTGLLVTPGDSQLLAEAILKLLNNRILAEEMGRAGEVLVLEEFTMEKTVEKTIAVYSDLLAETGSMKVDGA